MHQANQDKCEKENKWMYRGVSKSLFYACIRAINKHNFHVSPSTMSLLRNLVCNQFVTPCQCQWASSFSICNNLLVLLKFLYDARYKVSTLISTFLNGWLCCTKNTQNCHHVRQTRELRLFYSCFYFLMRFTILQYKIDALMKVKAGCWWQTGLCGIGKWCCYTLTAILMHNVSNCSM